MIIGLTGVAQSGKDTVADYLIEKHGFVRFAFADKVREHLLIINPMVFVSEDEFMKILIPLPEYLDSIAEKEGKNSEELKYINDNIVLDGTSGFSCIRLSVLVKVLGWDDAKKIADVRKLLQRNGTEAGREFFGDECWVQFFADFYSDLKEETDIVITDIRFDNEAEAIRYINVAYEKTAIVKMLRGGAINNHKSEQGISEDLVDAYIDNSGTLEELYEKVEKLLV